MNVKDGVDKCELCGIACKLEKHHLVPQVKCHSSKYGKNLKTDESNFLWICGPCHRKIHSLFTNNELRDMYNTRELLLSNEDMVAFVKWRLKHQNFSGSSKMSNRIK